jgi:hypothetical protein
MKKSQVEAFIKRYTLNGLIESVELVSDGKNLSTSFITDDKSVLGIVKGKDFKLDEFKIGVNDTSKLKNLLAILSEDVNVKLNKNAEDVPVSIAFSDKETVVNFMLADLSVIPTVPKLKPLPDFELEIPLTKEFISRFVKAKSALPEVDKFTLLMDKKNKLQFVVGYSENINSNRVSLSVEPKKGKDTITRKINLSAKYLREILVSNSEVEESVLYVSEKGFAKIELNFGDFETSYYLVEIKD